jgi:hypothetical protein
VVWVLPSHLLLPVQSVRFLSLLCKHFHRMLTVLA